MGTVAESSLDGKAEGRQGKGGSRSKSTGMSRKRIKSKIKSKSKMGFSSMRGTGVREKDADAGVV